MHYKKCVYCNKEFYADRHQTRYCSPECKKAAQKQRDEERAENEKNKEIVEEQKIEVEKPTLAEINRMAREAGMSYGKFVAMKYLQDQKIGGMNE